MNIEVRLSDSREDKTSSSTENLKATIDKSERIRTSYELTVLESKKTYSGNFDFFVLDDLLDDYTFIGEDKNTTDVISEIIRSIVFINDLPENNPMSIKLSFK